MDMLENAYACASEAGALRWRTEDQFSMIAPSNHVMFCCASWSANCKTGNIMFTFGFGSLDAIKDTFLWVENAAWVQSRFRGNFVARNS